MSISSSRNKLEEVLGLKISNYKISFSGVAYDSRTIRGGELFFCLKGETVHGHKFLDQALDRGAALVVVEDSKLCEKNPERIIAVSDSLKAFSDLAAWWRKTLALPIAAITGSVGKTTVKEMLASILLQNSQGYYSLKSYNNHVGVPYTILNSNASHKWLVLEMGMNHPGEIDHLAQIAKPNVAALISLAPAHAGVFKDLKAIAKAKAEIIRHCQSTIIYNSDIAEYQELVLDFPNSNLNKIAFGDNSENKIIDLKSEGLAGISFKLSLSQAIIAINMKIIGVHNAQNALAAAVIAKALIPEISDEEIKKGLERFMSPAMRLQLVKLQSGQIIVDDSYNANPGSMKAALNLAKELISNQQKVGLVIGDMYELGDYSLQYHEEIANLLASLKPNFLVYCGEYAAMFLERCQQSGVIAFKVDSPEAAAFTVEKLKADIVLFKASRGVGLDRAVQKLIELKGFAG